MFMSTVGRTFLKAYNEKMESNLSAEKFFYDVFVPLFFKHNKYMMSGGNSPLENSFNFSDDKKFKRISWEKIFIGKKPYESEEDRNIRIKKMYRKIENEPIDASFARGFPTYDESTNTSGQITTIDINHTKEDIYYSWIGDALSIGIRGAITILFNDPGLLIDVYSGWRYYRKYLNQYPKLRGNQINTWNGHWLSHYYDIRKNNKENPLSGFTEPCLSKNGLLEFPTISWVNVITKIAQKRGDYNYIGYIYNIGQTNTTLGFIPFRLPLIRKPFELYIKLFGENDYLKNELKITELFGGEIGFRQSCQKGAIGIEALEPKGLKAYMPGYKGKGKMPDYRKADENQVVTFNTYKIWVLAMLNNEELWEKSRQIAKILVDYESGAGKAKMDRTNSVKKFLESSTKRTFIGNLVPIFESTEEQRPVYEVAEIVNKMSGEDVKYFITLIRFQYAGLKRNTKRTELSI